MNIYEFLTQSPKEIGKILKDAGIQKHQEVPSGIDELCRRLELEKDSRVTNMFSITRGGATEWHLYFDIDFGFGKQKFEVELNIKGKCSIKYVEIGGNYTSVKIFEKICPLFDIRPEYHNLEFSIEGYEYTPFYKGQYDDKEFPEFDNEKPLSEYIKIITDRVTQYKPIIEEVEKACFNGEYAAAYNKYHFNPFVVGHMIVTEDPGFSCCVRAIQRAKEKCDYDLTIANVQGLYRYMFLHIQEFREYNNDKTGDIKKPFAAYVNDLCWKPTAEDLNREILLELLRLADDEALVNKEKESWDSIHLKANREFFKGIEKLQKQIAAKYKIPEDAISFFSYDEDTDTASPIPVPESLKDRF